MVLSGLAGWCCLIALGWAALGNADPCCSQGLSVVRGGCADEESPSRSPVEPFKLSCTAGMYLLNPRMSDLDHFKVDNRTRELIVGDEKDKSYTVPQDSYCLGNLLDTAQERSVPIALVCVQPETNFMFIKGICTIISVTFLILTIISYILLPELRDLQGKCMMCAVISLAIAFLTLSINQLKLVERLEHGACVTVAIFIFYFMLAFFFWLNVVSFNLWRCVVSRSRKHLDSKLFVYYSAYSWGCPCALTFILLLLQFALTDMQLVGHHVCFISHGLSAWMFYLPIVVVLVANTIMYSISLWKLWKGMSNVVEVKRRSLKYKCCMYLKLFIISGLTWLFEIISFLCVAPQEWWIFTDVINGLQGLVMFLVLIALRPRALRALAGRGCWFIRMPQRWSLKPDTELLNDCDDNDDFDETTRPIDIHNGH